MTLEQTLRLPHRVRFRSRLPAVEQRQAVLVNLGLPVGGEALVIRHVARRVGSVAVKNLLQHVVGLLPRIVVEEGRLGLAVDEWAEDL
eukprot:1689443-Prymnesium_polylepis.1